MKKSKSPDAFYANASQWRAELHSLRKILQTTELTEEIKWGVPCYTYGGKNIVGVGAFKSYFGLWFHQGALLQDKDRMLINAQEGKTKALRQWRMQSAKDIRPALIMRYLKEAIGNAKEGKEIKPDRAKPLIIPVMLKKALSDNKTAQTAFKKLTPGLQREYAEYISGAKQDATKQRRLEKILPIIKAGKSLNDKYR